MAVSPEEAVAVLARARQRCEICGKRTALQLHHSLIHRDRNNSALDHRYNLSAVCKPCHDTKANSRESETKHYRRVSEYYGKENVEAWIDSLGLKTREYWD